MEDFSRYDYMNDPYENERYEHTATESEAHAEWHRNAGVPMGQPGCPQDACHGDEFYDDYNNDDDATAAPYEPPPTSFFPSYDPADIPF